MSQVKVLNSVSSCPRIDEKGGPSSRTPSSDSRTAVPPSAEYLGAPSSKYVSGESKDRVGDDIGTFFAAFFISFGIMLSLLAIAFFRRSLDPRRGYKLLCCTKNKNLKSFDDDDDDGIEILENPMNNYK